MSGFQFSLKSKKGASRVTKPIKSTGILKGRPLKKINSRAIEQDSDSDSDSEKVVSIDSFDKGGASKDNVCVDSKPKSEPLIIKQVQELDWKLKLKAKAAQKLHAPESVGNNEASEPSEDQLIRQSLISGEKLETENGLTIQVSTQDESNEADDENYDSVPVEQFGAAMLRGMGWKPTKNGKSSTDSNLNKIILKSRQRSAMLGIGAEQVESELMNSKMKAFEVPIIKRNRETGEVVPNDKH